MKIRIITLLLFISAMQACINPLTETEQKFLGYWRMTNYESNEQIAEDAKAGYFVGIENLKKNFSLTFNDDMSFVRTGFAPQPEKGEWSINPNGTMLTFKGENDQNGIVFVESINESMMVIRIEENQPQNNQSLVIKLTLTKTEQ